VAAEIPADADSAKKYIRRDGTGLVETEKDGVTIVSRPEAAE
jgi:multidrug efflux pump